MRVLGLIPARGGSKGVPRKNVRLLAGKPLIAYSIETARQSRSLSEVLVSTDDEEIASVSAAAGAAVLRRPADIARDATPMADVVAHVLRERGAGVDVLVLLQPTCPQRTAADVDAAVSFFADPTIQSVISVYQVEDHHPARMYRLEAGRLAPLFPDQLSARRQELPAVYHRNGAVYACRTGHFQRTGSLWDDHPAAYVMPRERSINIDDPLDFQIADWLLGQQHVAAAPSPE
jgi:CMP-N-acetylneuraminic acid synthetase